MSHFVARSIVLTKNEIILKGGDNNVVPRDHHEVRIPRTVEEMRTFVKQDLLGGCVKPVPSANDYFWWWLMRRAWWGRYSYSTVTDHELDRLAEFIQEEWDRRHTKQNCTIQIVDDLGKHVNYVKKIRGVYYVCRKPQRMSMYHAVYLKHKDGAWLSNHGHLMAVGHID